MTSKRHKSILVFATVILIGSASVMVYMLLQLRNAEEKVAKELISKPLEITHVKLNKFFDPVRSNILAAGDQGRSGFFKSWSERKTNNYFIPIVESYDQISSMGIAHSGGYEMDIIRDSVFWSNRIVDYGVSTDTQRWVLFDHHPVTPKKIKIWFDEVPHDPRERSWFTGAIKQIDSSAVHWTQPYIYNTTGQLGITASVGWHDIDSDTNHVLAYDLTLANISEFTSNLDVSENGMAFVLSNDGKFIGIPDMEKSGITALENALNKTPSEANAAVISKAIKRGQEHSEAFQFDAAGKTWWASFQRYKLGPGNTLVLGVIIPEEDVTAELVQTRYTVIGGFSIVFLLSLIVFRSLRQTAKANEMLEEQNEQIKHQHAVIEEKNKDIMDSIEYARRIQTAILPDDEQNSELLGRSSFVFFRPKDVVSGDFYWIDRKDGKTCFTVSDCTGHGVPGAFMSMIGASLYNQVVLEKGILKPSEILFEVRRGIIQSLQQQGKQGEQKDGMDAAFCVLHEDGTTLEYAGAHNPLYMIRKGSSSITIEVDGEPITLESNYGTDSSSLYEIKGDKQPIGFYTGEQKQFSNARIQLQKGDIIYLFSDGFADQFGGEKGKKYKYANFKRYLLSIHDQDMRDQYEQITREFEEWKGEFEQLDDVCIIGMAI